MFLTSEITFYILLVLWVRIGLSFNCVYNINNGIYRIKAYLLTYLLTYMLAFLFTYSYVSDVNFFLPLRTPSHQNIK